jgi:hypothetical protein
MDRPRVSVPLSSCWMTPTEQRGDSVEAASRLHQQERGTPSCPAPKLSQATPPVFPGVSARRRAGGPWIRPGVADRGMGVESGWAVRDRPRCQERNEPAGVRIELRPESVFIVWALPGSLRGPQSPGGAQALLVGFTQLGDVRTFTSSERRSACSIGNLMLVAST